MWVYICVGGIIERVTYITKILGKTYVMVKIKDNVTM